MAQPLYGKDCITGESRPISCDSDGAMRISVDGQLTSILEALEKKPKLTGRPGVDGLATWLLVMIALQATGTVATVVVALCMLGVLG